MNSIRIFFIQLSTIIFFAFLFTINVFSQNTEQFRTIDESDYLEKIDSLRSVFNKCDFDSNFELETLIALSYFPELEATNITFKKAKIHTTSSALPTFFSSIFKKKAKRKYIIRINNQKKDSIIHPENIPFNARIGLIGHELSHVADYQSLNIFQLIGRLFDYIGKKGRTAYENEIDRATIEKGLGWQLYDWSYFAIYQSHASSNYKSFKKKIYLSPDEIEKNIEKL